VFDDVSIFKKNEREEIWDPAGAEREVIKERKLINPHCKELRGKMIESNEGQACLAGKHLS